MTPLDFIATARDLAGVNRQGRPRQTNLRRAVSTAYYALFHCLAACCADLLVGGPRSDRSRPAWNQAYRALEHGLARNRCSNRDSMARFPPEVQDFAKQFVYLPTRRHRADYDPDATFLKSVVVEIINDAEPVIRRFAVVPVKDRRAFAVYVLLPLRSG